MLDSIVCVGPALVAGPVRRKRRPYTRPKKSRPFANRPFVARVCHHGFICC